MHPILTHIALHVKNFEACVTFYQEYCGLHISQERPNSNGGRVVWLAEKQRETHFVIVLLPGGAGHLQKREDYSHLGFALESEQEVEALAAKAREQGCLAWEPTKDAYPAGFHCGVYDPSNNVIEFSYGQPLGPGAQAESGE